MNTKAITAKLRAGAYFSFFLISKSCKVLLGVSKEKPSGVLQVVGPLFVIFQPVTCRIRQINLGIRYSVKNSTYYQNQITQVKYNCRPSNRRLLRFNLSKAIQKVFDQHRVVFEVRSIKRRQFETRIKSSYKYADFDCNTKRPIRSQDVMFGNYPFCRLDSKVMLSVRNPDCADQGCDGTNCLNPSSGNFAFKVREKQPKDANAERSQCERDNHYGYLNTFFSHYDPASFLVGIVA